MASGSRTYLLAAAGDVEGDRMVHLVAVVDLQEIMLLRDRLSTDVAREKKEKIFVGRNARTHDSTVIDVEKDMKNCHHPARIISQLSRQPKKQIKPVEQMLGHELRRDPTGTNQTLVPCASSYMGTGE